MGTRQALGAGESRAAIVDLDLGTIDGEAHTLTFVVDSDTTTNPWGQVARGSI